MTKPQIMTNSTQVSYNSLPDHVQSALQQKSYEFGKDLCKNVGITHNGAAEFISRELTYFFPQLLLQRYPELTFRLYTPTLGAPLWKKNIAFNIADLVGQAQFKNTRANDFDYADTNMTEMISDILQTGMAISFSFIERMAAEAVTNPAVQQEASNAIRAKMAALLRMNEAKLNSLFFNGDTSSGTYGLLTDPSIPKSSVGTDWGSATKEQKLSDILACYNNVMSQSKGVFRANTLAMSMTAYTSIQAEPRSTYSDWTLLKWAEANLPGIDRIIPDPYLDDVGESSSDVIVAFDRDELNYNMVISGELIGLPVQYEGQVEKLPFITRSSGLNVLQSQSINILQGL